MACAKPIITTNMPGCSHLVNNSKPNGLIVNPLNEKNLSEALLKLFASDLKLYGENSRLLYLEKFSEKVIFDLIYNFYNY
jgi:glycosyltransferase involved in cell wall biosynthesis